MWKGQFLPRNWFFLFFINSYEKNHESQFTTFENWPFTREDPFWGSPIYDADHIPLVLNATDERRTHERMARNLWLAKRDTRVECSKSVSSVFSAKEKSRNISNTWQNTFLNEKVAGGRRCSNAGVTQSSLKYASISFVLLCQSLAEPVSASFGSCPFCKGRKSRNNRQCSRRPSFRAGFTRELRREYDGSPTDCRAWEIATISYPYYHEWLM